jgi:hypothetical protein
VSIDSWPGQGEGWYGDTGFQIFKSDAHAIPKVQSSAIAAQQASDEAYVRLLINGDINQGQRQGRIKAGQKRLMEYDPRADGTAAAHRLKYEGRVGAMAVGADDVGRVR